MGRLPHSHPRALRLLVPLLVWLAAAPVQAWFDGLDAYVASLNSPQARQSMGVASVRRHPRFVNRLEVTFAPETSQAVRARVLRQLAHQFMKRLFLERRVTSARVLERDASGAVLHSVVVTISGGAGSPTGLRPAC